MTRDDAIEVIKNLQINIGRRNGKHLIKEAMDMAIEALETATPRPNDNLINFGDIGSPSIKPLERKRGEWVIVKGSNGKDYRKCTNCLHTQEITGLLNYCPVCGAEMVIIDHIRKKKEEREEPEE